MNESRQQLFALNRKFFEMVESFNVESLAAANGNKSADRRCRKITLEIEKLGKEWRKASLGL